MVLEGSDVRFNGRCARRDLQKMTLRRMEDAKNEEARVIAISARTTTLVSTMVPSPTMSSVSTSFGLVNTSLSVSWKKRHLRDAARCARPESCIMYDMLNPEAAARRGPMPEKPRFFTSALNPDVAAAVFAVSINILF
jgi:hypothetical protein